MTGMSHTIPDVVLAGVYAPAACVGSAASCDFCQSNPLL